MFLNHTKTAHAGLPALLNTNGATSVKEIILMPAFITIFFFLLCYSQFHSLVLEYESQAAQSRDLTKWEGHMLA